MSQALRRELPWLGIEVALLIVLLHSNPPEMWFWLGVLVVLQLWRHLRWRSRTRSAVLEDQGENRL